VNDPGARNVTFDELRVAYAEQTRGLIDGGVDLLLVETIFDTLNAKAALFAIDEIRPSARPPACTAAADDLGHGHRRVRPHPVGPDGRGVLEFGAPCPAAHHRPELRAGRGADAPVHRRAVRKADTFLCVYPNAGLPNPMSDTGFDETPDVTSALLGIRRGRLRQCGGRLLRHHARAHRAIARAVASLPPRVVPQRPAAMRLSGLEPFNIDDSSLFVNVGERTNVTGSKAFARLILNGQYDEALAVARQQVENGAQVIDVNMDEAMLDSAAAMSRFLNLIASEPDIARVPMMIDSSKWEVIEAGLKCVQGKAIVNSISMKEGEDEFLRQARTVPALRRGGDRDGLRRAGPGRHLRAQDRDLRARLPAAGRAGRLSGRGHHLRPEHLRDRHRHRGARQLRGRLHRGHALDPANLPHAHVSGGVSNVSFSFRGNDPAREAIHTVFLYHAIRAG
jgi:5-methyltetrahydrofolate--homocysteine methyltransferase